MSDQLILTERPEPGVLVITINRPQRRNAFDGATSRALEEVIDQYEADRELRCAILTGADGMFSAGQDLKALATGDFGHTERRGGFGIMARPPVKPIIAAVEGHALAGGLELCLSCDLIVAAENATMGLPEASRSLVALGGGLFRLPKRIPYHVAMELALTGKPVPATTMRDWGLVNRLAEPGQALAVALELAREVTASAPLAVIATKEMVRQSYELSEEDAWQRQQEAAKPVLSSQDLQEGLQAFAQKRPPVWSGQ
jgi:enoyl-CoA hydratase